MGKHVFTLNLTVETESPAIEDGESGRSLTVSPEALYHTVNGLRSEILSDIEVLSAQEFTEAMKKASEINQILGEIEELDSFSDDAEEEEEVE